MIPYYCHEEDLNFGIWCFSDDWRLEFEVFSVIPGSLDVGAWSLVNCYTPNTMRPWNGNGCPAMSGNGKRPPLAGAAHRAAGRPATALSGSPRTVQDRRCRIHHAPVRLRRTQQQRPDPYRNFRRDPRG